MNEFKNLTNVVIGKLGKLDDHKQNCFHDFCKYFINYNIIIVHVRYIIIETKEVFSIGCSGFFLIRTQVKGSSGKRSQLYPVRTASFGFNGPVSYSGDISISTGSRKRVWLSASSYRPTSLLSCVNKYFKNNLGTTSVV